MLPFSSAVHHFTRRGESGPVFACPPTDLWGYPFHSFPKNIPVNEVPLRRRQIMSASPVLLYFLGSNTVVDLALVKLSDGRAVYHDAAQFRWHHQSTWDQGE